MALYNARGRFPDNWTADIVRNGEFVGSVISFKFDNGEHVIRVRDDNKIVVREFTSCKGKTISMDDLKTLTHM